MAAIQTEVTKWQLQEAKQHFSEVVRKAHDEGPQIVTKHGKDVVVILDMEEYRQLKGKQPDFKEFLLSGPDLSTLDLTRDKSTEMRAIDLGDDE
ncbi:type II toxin-antitoxin system Phd/YefM family antitoxin [Nonomuraea angiospora]|uniref:Antitoxin n=1 Tax=Nonomuraea angiospora TaxID=46172 RepID=A0ABR9LWG1_9ACTN|nr:type II toxin-antitoxin system Phd/YefM family antitoxin [Nonomuraea angiospora]MBE1584990.1 prevent-host-death family protein [Nonomuraea angiospora]